MQTLEIRTSVDFEKCPTTPSIYTEIPRISSSEPPLSYDEFFRKYMLPNRPVVLTGLACDWECFQHWSDPAQNSINFDYLRNTLQSLKEDVPVADCGRSEFNAHVKLSMKFEDFIQYWTDQQSSDKTDSNNRLLYLKDWHLQKQMPDYHFYETPRYFGSDWLNEYLVDINADDYKFVYMGPKGTWTPFHSDVFGSFSWSTNITGTKRWVFLAPGEETKLLDRLGNLPFTIDVSHLADKGVQYFIVEQSAGETVFVPSGWYHQVRNEADTISVNHNWFNGCNVHEIWRILKEMLAKVRLEIDDCRDMDDFDGHCQLMLRAGHGMNYKDFFTLLANVAHRRINSGAADVVVANGFTLNRNHCRFDLLAIQKILLDLFDGDEWHRIDEELVFKCRCLQTQINEHLLGE